MTTVIKGGTIVTADRSYDADVLIEGGRITAIGEALSGDTVIDATGAYVMPGGIDPHTHLEMPFMGTSTAETWESGTFAAASGGTTLVIDHIISDPDELLTPLDLWNARAARQASIDYGFHMSITGWSERVFDQMETVVARGVNTFKHFMAYKGALMVNDDEMFASFTRCAGLGAIPFVHAENGDLIAGLQQKLMAEGNSGPEAHAYSRPPEVEGEATNRAIMIADAVGVPVYIVHTSSEEAHEAIRRWRQRGTRVWGEPLIQHLILDESVYAHPDWDFAAQRVMSPPFRDKKHQDSLWAGLAAGSLHVVATDHCAFTTAQKQAGRGNFTKIPNGTGGLEDRLSLLWTHGVMTGRITMNEFVAVTSTNIAQILNIYPRKGAVMVGADADIVVFDPKASRTIRAVDQKSIIDYNVFEGYEVTGMPRYTLSRGDVVWGPGAVQPQPGRGRHIDRPAFPATSQALTTWRALTAPRPVARSEAMMPIGV
ncbi:MAG: dihydropyrimidinase [Pseudotabrizicola sp.]|uniref:dihydropyrimidinase n=1 Tax=Pseudotabrizicola sp. TaxID=2939647 RepID=UPI00272F3C96|nr:dihydropyrimidinase [Pseudotabrizicola sp.]MDP2083063.1 dihydropyrimidinase [Pseudotabrizicola sp.]MDZ7572481.1 dihydropyrimidinase [Pseudotabrizicola sp.]